MIESGRLRHQVTIEKRTETRNDLGEVIETWHPLCRTWAAIEPISSRERLAADASNVELTHRVTIRYRAGIGPGVRVIIHNRDGQDRRLIVTGVINKGERNAALEMTASEVSQ